MGAYEAPNDGQKEEREGAEAQIDTCTQPTDVGARSSACNTSQRELEGHAALSSSYISLPHSLSARLRSPFTAAQTASPPSPLSTFPSPIKAAMVSFLSLVEKAFRGAGRQDQAAVDFCCRIGLC